MTIKITIEDINRFLGGVFMVKAKNGAISDTGSTHDMDTNYGSFLPHHKASRGEYFTLVNGTKDPIEDYGTILIQLGGWGYIDNHNVFHGP